MFNPIDSTASFHALISRVPLDKILLSNSPKDPWAGKKYLTVKNSQLAKAQPMSTDTLVEYDPILESSLMKKMYNLWYAAN